MLRQLIALGHLRTDGEFNTLEFTASSREVLRGEIPIMIRESTEARAKARARGAGGAASRAARSTRAAGAFEALKAWRAEVARENNLPAYVVFHDATLAAMAAAEPRRSPTSAEISGVGAKKLEAYGADILRVLEA